MNAGELRSHAERIEIASGPARLGFDELEVGRAYLLEGYEPVAVFDAGRLLGFRWSAGDDGDEYGTVLPPDYDGLYPDAIFERAVVGTHYMISARLAE